MKIQFLFKWYDLWVGIFYDRKNRWIYILPFPTVGIILKLPTPPVKKLNIPDVSGWVSVEDKANPMPNIEGLQVMFESGTYMDYDANPWPHEMVTHWRKKPCR